MSWIDFILNIAGLLLWLNWRAAEPPARSRKAAPFLLTLRPAAPPRPRYFYLGAVLALLAARAVFYWQAGPSNRWNPQLPLGPISLSFRSDMFGRMLLFSTLSFAAALGVFYLWLLILSWINAGTANPDPLQLLARLWLGRLERMPSWLKPIAPLVAAVIAWAALGPLLTRFRLMPASGWKVLLEQGALIGLSAYLTLKYLLVALLVLHVLNSYVYFGDFALWSFVNTTSRRLLRPWEWVPLRLGKIDLAPLLAIALIWLAADFAQRELNRLYQRLV